MKRVKQIEKKGAYWWNDEIAKCRKEAMQARRRASRVKEKKRLKELKKEYKITKIKERR